MIATQQNGGVGRLFYGSWNPYGILAATGWQARNWKDRSISYN
jgi:hypothetical protein